MATLASAALGSSASVQAAPPRPASLPLTVDQARVLPLSPALARGQVQQRALGLHGLPVRGAFETVRTRPDGTTEVLAARYPTAAPQLQPSDARIDASAVPGIVAAYWSSTRPAYRPGARTTESPTPSGADPSGAENGTAGSTGGDPPSIPALEEPPRLVYLLVLGQPVLAWETQIALVKHPEPSRPTLWVSAASGRVLAEVEQVRSSRARVFAENPARTPEPVEVELLDIDVEEAGHPLVGYRVQAFNCTDVEPEDPESVSPWWAEDECWPVQRVLSDAQGDFFVPTPDVIVESQNLDGNDLYAELSMYVHAERFLEAMAQRGVEQYRCELSSMLANFRSLERTGTLDFEPLNNAYYTDQCDPEHGPTMLFGQGSEVDFGYDGDVIYHELGHGMVALLAPEGLSRRRVRSDASLVDASGINEALADYFSVMITDDARLADYVGRFWSSTNKPYIRTAENDKTCPDDTIGQAHNDGEPLMAALWATRKRLDEGGKAALDRVVLEALMRLSPDADLEEAAAQLLELADLERQDGTLSADEVALLRRSLDTRGLIDCPRVITDPKRVRDGRTMYLRRVDDGVHPFYPGPMQLRYEVPPDADDMLVTFGLKPRGEGPVQARVLVKWGDAPIEFEYQLVAVDDGPPDEPGDDPVRELVLVTGDWDFEVDAVELSETDFMATVGGLEPGEVLHVMLVNLSRTEAAASGVSLRSTTEYPGAGEDEGETAGEPVQDTEVATLDVVEAGAGSSGCACASGERTAGDRRGAWWLALWMLALGGRARRGLGSRRRASIEGTPARGGRR